MRVGRWPKRLLVYRTLEPFPKLKIPGLEILGAGQQFVAFGVHPDIGQPYDWPLGESPLDIPIGALPLVDQEVCAEFMAEAAALILGAETRSSSGGRRTAGGRQSGPQRDEAGRVIDGRDGWLSSMAFHAVHDALDAGAEPLAEAIAARVWAWFEETSELGRPEGRRPVLQLLRCAGEGPRQAAAGR